MKAFTKTVRVLTNTIFALILIFSIFSSHVSSHVPLLSFIGRLIFKRPPNHAHSPTPTPQTRTLPPTVSMVNVPPLPQFAPCELAPHRPSGYWASFADLSNTDRPDVLAFGVRAGPVQIFHNPLSSTTVPTNPSASSAPPHAPAWPTWPSTILDTPEAPVAAATARLAGPFADIVLATRFGRGVDAIDDAGGQLVLYVNPRNEGRGAYEKWARFEIGRLAGTHRVNFGNFTDSHLPQLLAVPITTKHGDPFAPVALTLFSPSRADAVRQPWRSQHVSTDEFSVVHDVAVGRFRPGDARDSILVASNEGLTWVHDDDGWWKQDMLFEGLDLDRSGYALVDERSDVFSGFQNVDVGTVGNDSCAFIVTSAPFHGNVVQVHVKTAGAHGDLAGATWATYVLHTFDTMSPVVDGSGGVHQVAAVDVDGDGDDEVVIAHKEKGVFVARVAQIASGAWQISAVSNSPTLRMDFADVDGNSKVDIVTLGDTVHTDDGQTLHPKLLILRNLGT